MAWPLCFIAQSVCQLADDPHFISPYLAECPTRLFADAWIRITGSHKQIRNGGVTLTTELSQYPSYHAPCFSHIAS